MNILIFEDEKYNFDLLCQMLREQMPDCLIFGPLASIVEGKRFFDSNTERLDVIIADIQLNDGLSFYALTDAPADVPIIFTTAYDEYALKAFEYNSLSYLLKPIDEDALRRALKKTRERLITDEHREELFEMLAKHEHYCDRLLIKTFKGEKIIRVAEVRYFVSKQKSTFAKLHDGTSYELQKSLSSLETMLNPERFMRVNRQYIVPVNEVVGLEAYSNNREILVLKGDNPPEIVISRDNRKNVYAWLQR